MTLSPDSPPRTDEEIVAAVTKALIGFQIGDRVRPHVPREPSRHNTPGVIVDIRGIDEFEVDLGDGDSPWCFGTHELKYES